MKDMKMNSNEKFNKLISTKKGLMVDYLAVSQANENIKRFYGIKTEKELLDILGSDFYYYSVRDISQNEGFMKCYKKTLNVDESNRTCPFGINWNRSAYDSKFAVDESVSAPLKSASSSADIINYSFPKADDFDFDCLLAESFEHPNRVKVGGLWTGIMGDSYRMYGFERFLTDIALEPEIIHTLIDKLTDVYLEINNKYFETMKGKLDIWFFGNDFGSQTGLLMSENMWYEYFFENIKKLCEMAQSYGITVMMHSCGGIKPIIHHLINAGVEILDPIQITANNMDPEVLANDFGEKLIFHGGIDTQRVLPIGSVDEVRNESERLINIFENCGYIFAPGQVINKDVPAENIDAMYKKVKEMRK